MWLLERSVMSSILDDMEFSIGRQVGDHAHLWRRAALVFSSLRQKRLEREWWRALGLNLAAHQTLLYGQHRRQGYGRHHVARRGPNLRMMLARGGSDQGICHPVEKLFKPSGLLSGLHRFPPRGPIRSESGCGLPQVQTKAAICSGNRANIHRVCSCRWNIRQRRPAECQKYREGRGRPPPAWPW